MTAIDITFPASRPRSSLFGAEPLFAAAGALIGLSLAVTLAASALDPRLVQGENVWIKPIKFQVALSLYLLTLAFFARWLPAGMTQRRVYRVYSGLVVFAIAAELAWIAGASLAGTGSHFNVSTPLLAAVYPLMGVFAVLLTSASLVFGVAVARNPDTGLAPAVQLSIALGLVLTFLLTVPIAGTMAQGSGHLVGVPTTGASLPLLGWSLEVGDLRAPHFLATHAMHFLPAFGLLAAALLHGRPAVVAVWAGAVLYVGIVLASFIAALAGRPPIPGF